MKVLLVCCDYSLSGGSEKVAYRLYKELKNLIDIKIISVYCQNGQSSFDDSDVEYLIHEKGSFKKHVFKAIKLLSETSSKYGADILVSIGVSASYYVCISGKRNHIKTIVCEHSNIENKYYNDLVQLFSRSVSVHKCDRFITLTQEDMDNYIKKYPRYKEKFDYIYNWVEIEDKDKTNLYNSKSKKIITLSRIDRVKGFEYSIKVFEKISRDFPEWCWEVYGDGDKEYLNELKDYIEEKKIERFRFLGFCKDINKIYQEASIYCCTSIYEGLPLSLLEAKSYGIPIISFDCKTGPKEIIEDDNDGYLIELGDMDSFAKKLSILMKDDLLRKNMSDNSFLNMSKFDKNIIIDKWIKLFGDLTNKIDNYK